MSLCPMGTSAASCRCPASPAKPSGRRRRAGDSVTEKLKSYYGFTKTPFGRGLAPQMLHRHGAHAEAVARDRLVHQRTRPGRGHRRGRSRQDGRHPGRPRRPGLLPAHRDLPGQPDRRRPRPVRLHRHRARRRPPLPQGVVDPPNDGPARRPGTRTRTTHHRGVGRGAPAGSRPARSTTGPDLMPSRRLCRSSSSAGVFCLVRGDDWTLGLGIIPRSQRTLALWEHGVPGRRRSS